MIESSILDTCESPISAQAVRSQVQWSQKCCSSQASRLTQGCVLLSIWVSRPKRSIRTDVANISFLEGRLSRGVDFDLFASSALPRMRLLFFALN